LPGRQPRSHFLMSSCNSSAVKSRLWITNSSMSPSKCGLTEPGRLVIQQHSNSVIRESRIDRTQLPFLSLNDADLGARGHNSP
jgi:hypothetical protein